MKTKRVQDDENQQKVWKTYRQKRIYQPHQLEDQDEVTLGCILDLLDYTGKTIVWGYG